jgi:hypothetical protein
VTESGKSVAQAQVAEAKENLERYETAAATVSEELYVFQGELQDATREIIQHNRDLETTKRGGSTPPQ